ncbi:DUF1653 domain-containing protein [Prevotellamassilia timonensis]|uniref:DUF1653 domain-containing protein n=1 Tax=Prevotellamassilia timonensis TaxID=1852370 RepID=UPI0030793775
MGKSTFNSETQKHMVVHQALNGEIAYWLRLDKFFSGKVATDGKTFNCFTKTDNNNYGNIQ